MTSKKLSKSVKRSLKWLLRCINARLSPEKKSAAMVLDVLWWNHAFYCREEKTTVVRLLKWTRPTNWLSFICERFSRQSLSIPSTKGYYLEGHYQSLNQRSIYLGYAIYFHMFIASFFILCLKFTITKEHFLWCSLL